MAVTQQIGRVNDLLIQSCFDSDSKLEDLVSFKLLPDTDYIDLDWAPKSIDFYLEYSGHSEACRNALKIVLGGSCTIKTSNTVFSSGYGVYSDITTVSSYELSGAVQALEQLDMAKLRSCMPDSLNDSCALLGVQLDLHPNDYYLPIINSLFCFVKEATHSKLGLVQWWD